jgi:hypothetical protein
MMDGKKVYRIELPDNRFFKITCVCGGEPRVYEKLEGDGGMWVGCISCKREIELGYLGLNHIIHTWLRFIREQ